MPFIWHPNDPPPVLEDHSKAKLSVLRLYLRAYFDRLGNIPARDEFRLDLIDGFAGGGTFRDGEVITSGTPLIMLEEVEAARERLNIGRSKPLLFNCKFHFVDVNPDHTEHLRRVLTDRGHRPDGKHVALLDGKFEDLAESIIQDVLTRQPRAGRAIFLLDQCGFNRVALQIIARIFQKLPAAEVILTFAADALINHLAESPGIVTAVSPLEISEAQLHDLIEFSDGDGGRALVQRALRGHIRSTTGAAFDTPFFIRPRQSRRALWFLHLSRHPTARDVMIQCHWKSFNTFEHYGSGGFDMLGWDALHPGTGTLPLFHFHDIDAEILQEQLLSTMPSELYALASEGPISIGVIRHMFANRTAARFSDLDSAIMQLAREREFVILTPEGKERSRGLARIGPNDLVAIPSMRLFPGLSRLP